MSVIVVFKAFLALSLLCLVRTDVCPTEQAMNDEARLHKDLFCAYDSDYRPVSNHNDTVTVKVRLALKYITFDSLEETINVHTWVALSWKDELLKWSPSNYGNIKEVQVESHKIWTPRMSLFNADASTYPSDSFYTTCLLSNNGTVSCVPHLVHSALCRTSLRHWPYDTQNCTLYFGSWMHSGEQVNFTFYRDQSIVRTSYHDGPGWKLITVTKRRISSKFDNSTYPMLVYTFVLKREAAGPAAIVVIPSLVIILLTISSLLLDINDNVRLTLACFSLFAHFIFLTEIGYDIPKHSWDTPIILLFIRDSMIVTLVNILLTLVLMSLRRRSVPPPTWIVSITRLFGTRFGKYVVFTEFDPNAPDGKILSEDGTAFNGEGPRANEWIQFANLVNSLVFIIIVLVYLILFCVYIPYKD